MLDLKISKGSGALMNLKCIEEIEKLPYFIEKKENMYLFCKGNDRFQIIKGRTPIGGYVVYTLLGGFQRLSDIPLWIQKIYVFMTKQTWENEKIKVLLKNIHPKETVLIVWTCIILTSLELEKPEFHYQMQRGLPKSQYTEEFLKQVQKTLEKFFGYQYTFPLDKNGHYHVTLDNV